MSRLQVRSTCQALPQIDPESLNVLPGDSDSGISSIGEKRGGDLVDICLLVLGWYSSAIACVTTSKRVLLGAPFPLLLCFTQFAISVGVTRVLIQLGVGKYSSDKEPNKKIELTLTRLVNFIAVSFCTGFIFTNMSFSLGSASFVETIKAGEPLSSVLLGYLILHHSYSATTYTCLVAICVGVGLSCMEYDHFSLLGFTYAVISNFCFSYRAVLAKKVYMLFPDEITEMDLFNRISMIGTLMLFPLALILEGSPVFDFLTSKSRSDANNEVGASENLTFFALLALLFFNGVMYCSYNVLSFLVLRRTDIIVHAILNICRRMAIILFTAFYFSVPISTLNAAGILLAFCGFIIFSVKR